MTKTSKPPKAIIFDVFGTIVDWRTSVARVAERFFIEKNLEIEPTDFAAYWRGQYAPSMAVIRSGERSYTPLDELHLENLITSLNHFGIVDAFNEEERQELNRAWEQLEPWSDSIEALNSLKQNHIIAPCSNGSISLMTRLAKFGSLPWDCILGAEIAQNYKPHPSVYLACCKALRLEPDDIMMVACHNDDLVAARTCGLQTGFIPRKTEHGPDQTVDLEANEEWNVIGADLVDLANKVLQT